MKFVVNTKVIDDNGEELSNHEIELVYPTVETLEEKHVVLGEGQNNMAEIAKQASMHGIWLAAATVAKKASERDEADLGSTVNEPVADLG